MMVKAWVNQGFKTRFKTVYWSILGPVRTSSYWMKPRHTAPLSLGLLDAIEASAAFVFVEASAASAFADEAL